MTTKRFDKEMGYMKNLFNAESFLMALVNTFNKNVEYKNLSEMHQELLETIQQNKMPTKGSQQSSTDRSNSDDNDEGKSKDKEEKEVTTIQLIQNSSPFPASGLFFWQKTQEIGAHMTNPPPLASHHVAKADYAGP
jgi:hypothetical protein